MVSTTLSSIDPILIVSLDAGSTSARTLLYQSNGRTVDGFGVQIKYKPIATPDGGWEVDPDRLLRVCYRCLEGIHDQMKAAGLKPAAVAACTFWHSFHGLDARDRPTTRILHLLDTRSTGEAKKLKGIVNEAANHSRTGCVIHTSYWPAKLLWLRENYAQAFAATRRWISFGEYLLLQLTGDAASSTSMVSASGLWNQNAADYEQPLLDLLQVGRDQLADPAGLDRAPATLRPRHAARLPLFDGIPWFPALGDGACNNIGSGCVTPDRFAVMVGTTAVMRAVFEQPSVKIEPGVWCYRVDPKRFVMGGALSNGGSVYEKLGELLRLPKPAELEIEIAAMAPGSHKLTVLPFFNGERSTRWNADARAAFTGLSNSTTAVELVRAAMESVALRLRLIYDKLTAVTGVPTDIIASGSALDHSAAWTQMIADALGRRVVLCGEKETSSRGAALLAAERLGCFSSTSHPHIRMGREFEPVAAHAPYYHEQLARQEQLYQKLFQE